MLLAWDSSKSVPIHMDNAADLYSTDEEVEVDGHKFHIVGNVENIQEKHIEKHESFVAQIWAVIELVCQHIGNRMFTANRQAFYNAIKNVNGAQLQMILHAITLTHGIHPNNLDVQPNLDGEVWVGSALKPVLRHIVNWFPAVQEFYQNDKAWPAKDGENIKTMRLKNRPKIPPRIISINSKSIEALRAVIVVEYNSVNTTLPIVQEELSDCIVVTVCARAYIEISLTHSDWRSALVHHSRISSPPLPLSKSQHRIPLLRRSRSSRLVNIFCGQVWGEVLRVGIRNDGLLPPEMDGTVCE